MDTSPIPERREELAVIADRHGRPESVIVPIAAWDALPSELRETLDAGTDVDFPMSLDGERRLYAQVYWKAYQRIREDIEDAIDALAFDRAKVIHDREGGGVPLDVVQAIEDGRHPIAAWRRFRKMRQADLAAAIGLGRSYLAHIEGRARQGTPATMMRIARALGCRVDDLLPED